MKISDIIQWKRDGNDAVDTAGRGEFRWFLLFEKLDELGYDVVQRPVSPASIARVMEATAAIADPVQLSDFQAPDPGEPRPLANGEFPLSH